MVHLFVPVRKPLGKGLNSLVELFQQLLELREAIQCFVSIGRSPELDGLHELFFFSKKLFDLRVSFCRNFECIVVHLHPFASLFCWVEISDNSVPAVSCKR